jgi:flagellar biosynthesis protein FlhG
MKPLDELDHYEVLEIPPGAGFEDIQRAYRMTRAAYAGGSMATYSIYNRDDTASIRSRIDEAYRILADPEGRAKYDAEVGITPIQLAASPTGDAADLEALKDLDDSRFATTGHGSAGSAELPSAIEAIDDVDAEIDAEGQEINGAALRRARMRRGVELDQITDVTKVSLGYLGCIENDDFDKLPATVYIRGFVHAYARAIGLDADRVVANYMARVDAARKPTRRSLRSGS